jgi:predicted metal-binding transcription factor (methanogenesis marker protein 9)
MMRYIRRTFRQWRDEFLAFWGKFNTFYRMVFGIILAMIMVVAARRNLLDARRKAVTSLEKELSKQSVPVFVPSPSSDNEVQEAELLAESLQASLERERHETRAVMEERRNGSQEHAREALENLGRLIVKHRLMVQSATRCEAQDEFPLPRLCQACVLTGDFNGIYGFLTEIAKAKSPCRIRDVVLTSENPQLNEEHFTKKPGDLVLTFVFESFYVEL